MHDAYAKYLFVYIIMMTSPTPNQASGSDRIDQAPEKGSDHTEKVEGSHNT